MGIRDANIEWIRARKYYNIWELNCLISRAVDEGGATAHAEGEIIGSPLNAATATLLREVSTLGIVGLGFEADGDLIQGAIILPSDLDPKYEVGFKINFTQSTTNTTGVTWILTYKVIAPNVAIATSATALDTVIAEKNNPAATAFLNLWTSRGIAKASSLGLTRTNLEAGTMLVLKLEMDEQDTCDNVTLLGIEMDYVPIRTIGNGVEYDCPLTTSLTNA